MNDLLISVIVPCYNQAQYLDECLQSVLNQTCQDWECIIVNDGSPDDTEEIALQWCKKDDRFKYLNKKNGGISSARNAGIERANGEWILPLDADDKIGNQYLELAQKEFGKDYSVIYCKAEFFGEITRYWDLPKYNYQKILFDNLIFCSAFFRKEDWEKVNGYDLNLIYGCEDWDFWLSILNEGKKVFQLDYLGFHYRRKHISRNSSIIQDRSKTNHTLNYMYKKHLDKYIPQGTNAIKYYQKQFEKVEKLEHYIKKIDKNFITRILFRLIKKLFV